MKFIDDILYRFDKVKNFEYKLLRCQGYRPKTLLKWRREAKLEWKLAFKIFDKLEIIDAKKVRDSLLTILRENESLFNQKKVYVTSFGEEGKSGGIVCYEFLHTKKIPKDNFKKSHEIAKLPPNSNIVFVDDLIGTGKQSLDYINDRLNLFMSPSHTPFLMTLYATPKGIKNVEENSNFKVIVGKVLNEKEYQHLSDLNTYFTPKEKASISQKNQMLLSPRGEDFNLGLLIAFYYGIPNNTMPIIWKDGFRYIHSGKEKKWYGLIPRQF